MMGESVENAHVLVLEDNSMENSKMTETMKKDATKVMAVTMGEQAMEEAKYKDFDLIVVSLNMTNEDGLRMCSFFRSNERSRSVPILMVGEEQDMDRIARGLEIGAHDYILRPLDRNEFIARVRTQIRRKRYQDRLRTNYELSLSMALTDELTKLYNRRYLMVHLEKILAKFEIDKKPVTLLMMDIDFFKKVNDTHGHDVGDDVLKIFAERVNQGLRSFDMVARMGGEEFVAILPDAPLEIGMQVAERLRGMIGNKEMPSDGVDSGSLPITVSIGGFVVTESGYDTNKALKEADEALYEAKEGGRNCSFFKGIGKVDPARLPQRKPIADEDDTEGEIDNLEAAEAQDVMAPAAPAPTPAAPPPSGMPADPIADAQPTQPAAPSGMPADPIADVQPQQPAQPSGMPVDPIAASPEPAQPAAPQPAAPPVQPSGGMPADPIATAPEPAQPAAPQPAPPPVQPSGGMPADPITAEPEPAQPAAPQPAAPPAQPSGMPADPISAAPEPVQPAAPQPAAPPAQPSGMPADPISTAPEPAQPAAPQPAAPPAQPSGMPADPISAAPEPTQPAAPQPSAPPAQPSGMPADPIAATPEPAQPAAPPAQPSGMPADPIADAAEPIPAPPPPYPGEDGMGEGFFLDGEDEEKKEETKNPAESAGQ